VAVANGGTGATTAAGALANLGAYPASNPSGYLTGNQVVSLSGDVTGFGGHVYRCNDLKRCRHECKNGQHGRIDYQGKRNRRCCRSSRCVLVERFKTLLGVRHRATCCTG
jgi:hypothetical protein